VKKEGQTAKRRGEKIGAKMQAFFLFFFFTLSLSIFTSLSLVFWIFGKVVRGKKRNKKRRRKKREREK
jgi:hypothetical protein